MIAWIRNRYRDYWRRKYEQGIDKLEREARARLICGLRLTEARHAGRLPAPVIAEQTQRCLARWDAEAPLRRERSIAQFMADL